MKTTDSTHAQTPQELLNELHALVSDAEHVLADLPTSPAWEKQRDAVKSKLTDIYTNARTTVVTGAKRTDSFIRENPYQSLALIAGVGLISGMILGRRK